MTTEKAPSQLGVEILDHGDKQFSAWHAFIAMGEIGRHLQTVERQIRPQLLVQIENAGKRFHAIDETKEAGQLILLMCAFWRGDLEFPNVWNADDMRRRMDEASNRG